MKTENNVIIFDNDDELTDYCVCNHAEVVQHVIGGDTYYGYDYPYTELYNDAIATNTMFKVADPMSKVMKRGCACRGVVSKKIQNLLKD